MPNLGTKYVCFSCQTKFYDLGREVALCPKCGVDQKDADSAPAPVSRSRRVVVEVVEEEVELDESPDREDEPDDEVDLVEDEADASPGSKEAEDDDEAEEFD